MKAAVMPHLKCDACKTRLYRAGSSDGPVHDLCPGCGSPLDPVAELANVVGFRRIGFRDSSAEGGAPGARDRLADRVGDLVAHRAAREVILAEARLDAECWIDDGESLRVEAVPLPRPPTNA
ncbi:MAG: hypothetical protein E6G10_19165 [Actinobacteria bacterium]|nr:MAG: hypothetical protein E6G10_19165 [Actinomycetota bacterium]